MPVKIVLFTMPECPTCRAERTWLAERDLEFSEYDLTDPAVREELGNLEKRIQRRLEHVPVTVINGKVYEGFEPAAFEEVIAAEDS